MRILACMCEFSNFRIFEFSILLGRNFAACRKYRNIDGSRQHASPPRLTTRRKPLGNVLHGVASPFRITPLVIITLFLDLHISRQAAQRNWYIDGVYIHTYYCSFFAHHLTTTKKASPSIHIRLHPSRSSSSSSSKQKVHTSYIYYCWIPKPAVNYPIESHGIQEQEVKKEEQILQQAAVHNKQPQQCRYCSL